MGFLGTLIISLLLYHRVIICTRGSFLRDKTTLTEENILEKFFAEAKIHFGKYNPRQVTIIGTSDDQIRQTKSLLEAFPYSIDRDATKFCTSKKCARDCVIIYFLASMEKRYLEKVAESLIDCKKIGLIFIFEGIAAEHNDIDFLLHITFKKIANPPFFIHHSGRSFNIYGSEMASECSRKVKLLGDRMPWENMTKLKIRHDHNANIRCRVTVGTMPHKPWMNLADDVNGSKKIVNGLEGDLISTVFQKLNITSPVKVMEISVAPRLGKIEPLAMSCAAGEIDIGIGHIRPTESIFNVVEISHSYAQECVIWCVPRITNWKNDIITSEFSLRTWVLIGMTFLASFVLEKIVRNTHNLNRGNINNSGYCRIILDLIGSTLGNPMVYRPLSIGGKALLMIYICYSMVLTTAYKTSLSSLLTVGNIESSIVDIDGIIKANLTAGGSIYKRAILEDQMGEHELTPELIKRFVIETNFSRALRRISEDKDFAYLTSLMELDYHKNLLAEAGEHFTFDVLSGCVLNHGLVMVFPKLSPITERANQVLQSLSNGGLIDYWMKNNFKRNLRESRLSKSLDMANTVKELQRLTRDKFVSIFYIYCLALIFCILIFLGEILIHKLRFADRVRRFEN